MHIFSEQPDFKNFMSNLSYNIQIMRNDFTNSWRMCKIGISYHVIQVKNTESSYPWSLHD